MATAALKGALTAIREKGGGLVEAYPPRAPIKADYAHGGAISMFEGEVFVFIGRPDAPYAVMQMTV
jgi:hypothetical protein